MTRGRKGALCLLAFFVLYLPFLNQAFHIDDPYYLKAASQIVKDPLHPYAFECNWDGVSKPYYRIAPNPPLHSYFLALMTAAGKGSEAVCHLGMFLFVALFFAGMWALGLRFGADPLAAAALALATPAVLVMEHTCMADLPLLAFYVLALAAFIRGVDRGSGPWLWAAGGLAGAACLVKYTGVTLLPLFFLYAWLHPERGGTSSAAGTVPPRSAAAAALLIPLLCLAAWLFWQEASHGLFHLGAARSEMRSTGALSIGRLFSPSSAVQYAALLVYVGMATLFPAGFLLVHPWGRRSGRIESLLCLAGAALLLVLLPARTFGPGINRGLFLLSLWAAASFLAERVRAGWRADRDLLFLTAWLMGILLSSPLICFSAVRRILPLVPPLVLLFLRALEESGKRRWTPALIVSTLILGLCVSWADFQQAESYRRFAREAAPSYRSPTGRSWFAGQWGFLYYMERQGFAPLDLKRDRVEAGDTVLAAGQPWPWWSPRKAPPGSSVSVVRDLSAWLPLRTLSQPAGINFYSAANAPGIAALLPYGFSGGPLEVFVVCRWGSGPAARSAARAAALPALPSPTTPSARFPARSAAQR